MLSLDVIDNMDDDSSSIVVQDTEVAVGICAGTLYNDDGDDDGVTAEFSYPLASAAFITTNNQTLTDDFLILSNTEDNDFNFGDIVFAQPLDYSIEAPQSNGINSISLPYNDSTMITAIREALNSIDDDDNNKNNNNSFSFFDDDIKLQYLHDLGIYNLEKDNDIIDKTIDDKDYIDDSVAFTLDTNSYDEKLKGINEKDNSLSVNSLINNDDYKNEKKKHREEAIRKWKIKRSKRNWLKHLPERSNRREVAVSNHRVSGKGIFLRSKAKR